MSSTPQAVGKDDIRRLIRDRQSKPNPHSWISETQEVIRQKQDFRPEMIGSISVSHSICGATNFFLYVSHFQEMQILILLLPSVHVGRWGKRHTLSFCIATRMIGGCVSWDRNIAMAFYLSLAVTTTHVWQRYFLELTNHIHNARGKLFSSLGISAPDLRLSDSFNKHILTMKKMCCHLV